MRPIRHLVAPGRWLAILASIHCPSRKLGAVRPWMAALASMAACWPGAGMSPAAAGDMIFKFVDPSFAGGPAASSHLIGIATATNDTKDKKQQQTPPQPQAARSAASSFDTSPGAMFARQLQSQLLSQVSNQVVEAMFGQNPQDHGKITFGAQTITFDRGIEGIKITIVDAQNGQTTEVSVPTLSTIN